MARRAGIIAPEAIRDDGVTTDRPLEFHGLPGFSALVAELAADYRRDRLDGQPVTVEVWSEAAGMVPQLARVAAPYGVAVYSGLGFDSLTAKIAAAERAAASDRPLVVLHVGDHDPSGVPLFSSAYEDVEAWALHLGGAVTFERVAVTPEQIIEYGLDTAPPEGNRPASLPRRDVPGRGPRPAGPRRDHHRRHRASGRPRRPARPPRHRDERAGRAASAVRGALVISCDQTARFGGSFSALSCEHGRIGA